jgi:hypothetical protein
MLLRELFEDVAMTYHVLSRKKTKNLWSGAVFDSSPSFEDAAAALKFAQVKVNLNRDVYIDCSETDRLYAEFEFPILVKL